MSRRIFADDPELEHLSELGHIQALTESEYDTKDSDIELFVAQRRARALERRARFRRYRAQQLEREEDV
jgi:hypothetical protein